MKNALILISFAVALSGCKSGQESKTVSRDTPNIVYILADDLGYGDLSCYNPDGKIRTPNIDRLASAGMRFTDAHSPSSVCTPTRYALLTGQYPWRSRLPQGVLRGYGRTLIDSATHTVGSWLQERGYRTAVIGKWHLGLDWQLRPGHEHALEPGSYGVRENGVVTDMDPDHIDFTRPPLNGPTTRGFDYSFILPASLDMDPYCYLENDTLTELPTAYTEGNDLNTGYTGAFWRAGKMAPSFVFEDVLPTFTEKAIAWLDKRDDAPFFLYLPLAAPHTPWVPTDEYGGKSDAGLYGDFVQMVDAEVGRILDALDSKGLSENTVVVFASDNGPYWRPHFIEKFNHRAAGPLKGMKADIWEGGHRVPFIVRWPGRVTPGTTSSALTTLTNLMATCAEIVGGSPPPTAIDSYSIVPVLQGATDNVPGQPAVIHHSSMGHFAIRQGDWKMIEKGGSGGFSPPATVVATPDSPEGQLYDLSKDIEESDNLIERFPDRAAAMQTLLDSIRNISLRRDEQQSP